MRNLGAFVLLCTGVGLPVPGVLCATTGVASLRLTNSLDCSGSMLLPSVNFTSGNTVTYVAGPNAPYNMPMLMCSRIMTSTDSTSTNTLTNAIDARVTCSPNGTWTLQAWRPTSNVPTCDTDVLASQPIWSAHGQSNNACVPTNLTLWNGQPQGSLSVTCFPTVFVDEQMELVGDKCRGAIDCATVTLYSATSDDLSASCSASSQTMLAPPDKSCQTVLIGNVTYSYRLGCTVAADVGIQPTMYDFTVWAGSSCEQAGGPSFHASGSSLSSSVSYDDNGLAYYDLYAINKVSPVTSDNYCQPITFGVAGGTGLPSLARDPTLPQRITVACGGPNRTLGATVFTYEQPIGAGGSGSACSSGSVRSVHVVPNICLDTYHNFTLHGTSGQCINKPTLAGPPQPVRIICNGPHLIPTNNSTNGSGIGTGTGTGTASGSATSSSNTNTASTSTTAGTSVTSSNSNSGAGSSTGSSSGSGSGSGSGNLPNGGFGFGSRYPCVAVMMVAWVGVYIIF